MTQLDRLAYMKDLLQRLRRHPVKHPTWIRDIDRVVFNAEFFTKIGPRVKMWEESNPGLPAPIVQDENGKLVWLNRGMRSRLRKLYGKQK